MTGDWRQKRAHRCQHSSTLWEREANLMIQCGFALLDLITTLPDLILLRDWF